MWALPTISPLGRNVGLAEGSQAAIGVDQVACEDAEVGIMRNRAETIEEGDHLVQEIDLLLLGSGCTHL